MRLGQCPIIIIIIKLHFASQVIVQKQQMYLGAKRTPPGKSGRALQLPRACAGCGCFTTCTGHGGNSSKRLLKDRPTQADQQIPNQTTAVGQCPLMSKTCKPHAAAVSKQLHNLNFHVYCQGLLCLLPVQPVHDRPVGQLPWEAPPPPPSSHRHPQTLREWPPSPSPPTSTSLLRPSSLPPPLPHTCTPSVDTCMGAHALPMLTHMHMCVHTQHPRRPAYQPTCVSCLYSLYMTALCGSILLMTGSAYMAGSSVYMTTS